MRTLKGYEAIEIAQRFNVALYDLYYKNEVTVEQAKQFIESKREPQSFVIENWPDTEEEAEQIILNRFRNLLKEQHRSSARIVDFTKQDQRLPIHLYAAQLAAQRLAQQNKLQIVETSKEGVLYRLPATVYFQDAFLDTMAGLVCEECAHLDVGGPFHETCLANVIEFLTSERFTYDEITEVRQIQHDQHKLSKLIRPGIGLLSKTVSETKSKWQSVLKPILMKEMDEEKEETPYGETDETDQLSAYTAVQDDGQQTIQYSPPKVDTQAVVEETEEDMAETDAVDISKRDRITKDELIRYLRDVEIVDENGEVTRLQTERTHLLEQISLKEQEIHQIEKQRAFWEKQFEEMNEDMDTMIQAMQIAKRRGRGSERTIDASFESHSNRY